jgi:predicted permease
MNETLLSAVVPVFCLALVGLAIRKCNWLTAEADQSLLRVNINLLLPCLILDSTLGNPALGRAGNLLLAPLVGFGTIALGLGVAFALRRLAGPLDERTGRTFAFSTGMYNYGYVPIPLTILLFNSDTLGVLFLHNVGVECALWTVGVMVLTGHGIGRNWRQIINAPLIAIVAALALNFAGVAPHIPAVIRSVLHLLADCAIPMALILIGATVADHLHDFHSAHGWRVIGVAALLRLGVLPALFLLLAKWLPVSVELKRVIVIEAAMGSAVLPIVLSKHYGGDTATALRVVVGTSALSFLTIPLWIRFGMKFAGL